ncbi:DUF6284 family protein [Micromonospora sp. NPDC000316]|uniref:DUF6284 family protein n=1 Tax=Micromonospora sp. NPDC000316 TaxID=3364216 RepID=UPI0036CBFB9D
MHRKRLPSELQGPTAADLAAIEREMPLIDAEIDLVDAELRVLTAEGGPSPLDWRRLRRAEARVTRVAAELAARPTARKAVA